MADADSSDIETPRALRKGWTTGACATAAAKAAYGALLTGRFEDPVTITLPRGETPSFDLQESAPPSSRMRATTPTSPMAR
jgi:cobalt-precorrin-5B (C1)-methyltransferase